MVSEGSFENWDGKCSGRIKNIGRPTLSTKFAMAVFRHPGRGKPKLSLDFGSHHRVVWRLEGRVIVTASRDPVVVQRPARCGIAIRQGALRALSA
jgi:hypothetical protein